MTTELQAGGLNMKVWIVHFVSESSDHFFAAFNRKPTEDELKTYIVQKFPFSVEDDGVCYVSAWHIEEHEVEAPANKPEIYAELEWL